MANYCSPHDPLSVDRHEKSRIYQAPPGISSRILSPPSARFWETMRKGHVTMGVRLYLRLQPPTRRCTRTHTRSVVEAEPWDSSFRFSPADYLSTSLVTLVWSTTPHMFPLWFVRSFNETSPQQGVLPVKVIPVIGRH